MRKLWRFIDRWFPRRPRALKTAMYTWYTNDDGRVVHYAAWQKVLTFDELAQLERMAAPGYRLAVKEADDA